MKNPSDETSRRSIQSKLIWLSISIAVGSIAFLIFFQHSFSASLSREKEAQSKYLSEVGVGIIKYFYQLAASGELSVSSAQSFAMNALESATYEDNGYFWINSGEGILLMQPYTPEKVGTNQINSADIKGNYFFREHIRKAKAGGGWVSYYWPKPNSEEEYPKISYVAYFSPWNWVLGTGVYLDDMQEDVFWAVFKASGILVTSFIVYTIIVILAANFFISQLSDLTIRDTLTNLYTKRFLKELIPSLIKKKEREKEQLLAAVFIDIDHFKKINDTYGHACGDLVLSKIATIMQEALRPDDFCIRYGGDEFVIVGFFHGESSLVDCVNRVRFRISKNNFTHNDLEFSITLSAGVAIYKHGAESFEDTVKRADQMLYQAKNLGRNRVEI
jgi:diguanylate cyclase (GGDEF)-like protein